MSVHNAQLKINNEEIYPNPYAVGDIYITTNSTNPADRFGGTWTQVKGRYLLCVDESVSEYNTSKKTLGSWNTNNTTLTVNQIPSHGHEIGQRRSDEACFTGFYAPLGGESSFVPQWQGVTNNTNNYRLLALNTGGGKGHNHKHIVPSFTVYVWYRTS